MKIFRDVRILPVVLVAIFGLAVLKIAGLVLGMAGAVGVVLLGASGGHTHSGLVGNLMIAGCALATSCYMVWFKKLIARYDVVTKKSCIDLICRFFIF